MTHLPNRTTRAAFAGVLGTLALALLLVVPNAGAAPVTNGPLANTPQPPPLPLLNHSEQMPAFLNGTVVNTIYLQGYFVGTLNASNATFGGEPMVGQPAIGVTPTVYPTDPAHIAPFIALVPWWGPASAPYAPAYHPAQYGIREMCAPATVAVCWDHPATINVPGLGVVPLPGHDHLIGTAAGWNDVWWSLKIVLVLNQSYWPGMVGRQANSIVSFADLATAQAAGAASSTLGTNTFFNFAVVRANGSFNPTPPKPSAALVAQESMPSFLRGKVVNTLYENGYFDGGNATHAWRYGMEPLLAAPEVGTNATHFPQIRANIDPFYVLVPWWGPASAPYAPAYDPAAYGIQLMCAPATISVCYDHPATIDVPGLGVVPLPGHDHLLGDSAMHQDIWWQVIVVLVTNASVFPDLNGTHGITSLSALTAARAAGDVSANLPTDVFLNFRVGY